MLLVMEGCRGMLLMMRSWMRWQLVVMVAVKSRVNLRRTHVDSLQGVSYTWGV